jgi:hypothetical protein
MLYSNLMGYTTRRPANYPQLDRVALMRDAHRIAKGACAHFPGYREALAYGLTAAWKSVAVRRQIQSLSMQAGQPAVPFTAKQISASRAATRRCGASLWAS